jgi:hypothetical protein
MRRMEHINADVRAAGPPQFPKTDKRLLGTWKTDKRRTFLKWNWSKDSSPKRKAHIKSLFGKWEFTYTRTKVISLNRPRKWESSRHYRILGADDSCVAIVEFGELEVKHPSKYWAEGLEMVKEFTSKPAIKVIHFDKKHAWFYFGNGNNREFLTKMRRRK